MDHETGRQAYASGKMLADVAEGVGYATFNQPEKRNAMSVEMWDGLASILDTWQDDPAVRVVVLRGEGRAFSAGLDRKLITGEAKDGILDLPKLSQAEAGAKIAQWQAAKVAASDALVAGGGTITHHHAVGRDHRPWLDAEVGPLGVDLLRAAKERLDPAGVMNPGKLLPPA